MLKISKLNEALDYLTNQTGRAWTQPELFDCITTARIDIHAVAPAESQSTVQVFEDGVGQVEKYRMPKGHTLLAVLYPIHVAELWVRGETKTIHALPRAMQLEGEYDWFTEPIKVTGNEVRFREESLTAIIKYWNESQKEGALLHRYPKWMRPIKNSSKIKSEKIDTNPWLIADPKDLEPEQSWYTPARYYARQLVKSDPTLLTKRHLLAEKVSQSLFVAGIYGRTKNKKLESGTVLKALNNIILG